MNVLVTATRADRTGRRAFGRRRCAAVLMAVLVSLAAAWSPAVATAQTSPSYREPFRPQYHFTPARNWMNDPNGLVYYKGEYHLFYQHNPFGNTWGHMSWGHAVSRDLVHWTHLPLAIPEMGDEMVFSGGAVVDKRNTSGFGTRANPPMVAIYTAARPGSQAQALAYSLDRGRTWTRYAGNPVLDIGSAEFRDPNVFWYEPEQRWIMAVALAVERKISFYSSPDLKTWTHLSDFGPAGAVGGVWECPDLFPLPVDGDRGRTKWVLVVSLNPGGIAGGSGSQYFVGRFDGRRFVADDRGEYVAPGGERFEGFEGTGYGAWTATGTAFGTGPAAGDLPGQAGVAGFAGRGLANSFHGGDAATGTLTSPAFEIRRPYINLLVGGGPHAHVPGTTDNPPPAGTVFADFEGPTYGAGWTATGTFAGTSPPAGTIGDQLPVTGYEGRQLVNTFVDHDLGTGQITSPRFEITSDYINLLVGGGSHPYPGDAGNPPTSVNLVVDGQVVRTATGEDAERLNWVAWNVSEFKGRSAVIDIVDENTGGWGHINVDQITFANAPARRRSSETAVNLIVDGEVVRTASGAESERLDWASWRVADLIGRQARIELVDRNTGGWGHILADEITFADAPARSVTERANWLDYGKDYYAAVSWKDAPGGRRIMIGWMNNWQYANAIPTSPWRSAMSVPREVRLERRAGLTELVQAPVRLQRTLHVGRPFRSRGTVRSRTRALPQASGRTLDIRATFRVGSAERFGFEVLAGGEEKTVIGYDAGAAELFVDRTRSGASAFSRSFADAVQRAPLVARRGEVKLRILVDWSSVEVFADEGRRVITDQVFPAVESDDVRVFAEGGRVKLTKLVVHRMRSAWGASAGG